MTDSPELSAARLGVDRAIREFARVCAREKGITEDAYVLGWTACAEYVDSEMMQSEKTALQVIVPDDQGRATSRGLFELGADIFTS